MCEQSDPWKGFEQIFTQSYYQTWIKQWFDKHVQIYTVQVVLPQAGHSYFH